MSQTAAERTADQITESAHQASRGHYCGGVRGGRHIRSIDRLDDEARVDHNANSKKRRLLC
jgi:hypothetical protein